jgi:hypothetical protein
MLCKNLVRFKVHPPEFQDTYRARDGYRLSTQVLEYQLLADCLVPAQLTPLRSLPSLKVVGYRT